FSYDGSNWIPYGLNGQLNTPIAYQPFMADAFGRLRVSDPETIFDSKQVYDNQPLLWDDQEESGSGTGSSHSTATASTTISVGAATAGVRGRQTFMRFNYQPGKSQLAFITFVLDKSGGGSGISRKVGLFDANTGLWFGDSGGTYLVGIRDGGSDTTTTQAFWNIDQMTGSGPSGVTLDFSKNQIL
ncbi:MAG: hypothetical protein GWN77_02605, partial [Gammaproteobacteria bacterium]|nr:hypothetical protein [Gammaproteobacteria bacterium]